MKDYIRFWVATLVRNRTVDGGYRFKLEKGANYDGL